MNTKFIILASLVVTLTIAGIIDQSIADPIEQALDASNVTAGNETVNVTSAAPESVESPGATASSGEQTATTEVTVDVSSNASSATPDVNASSSAPVENSSAAATQSSSAAPDESSSSLPATTSA